MDIAQFLNPTDEIIEDSIEQLDEQVLALFGPEIEAESDKELEILPTITLQDVLVALNTLRLYEEQQDRGNTAFIQALNRQERVIAKRRYAAVQQMDIRGFFNP
jgi:hypothetical protein